MQILYNITNHPVPVTNDNPKAGVAGVPPVIDTGAIIVDASNCQYFIRNR